MKNTICNLCSKQLNRTEIKKNAQICYKCYLEKRIVKIQTSDFLNKTFEEEWSASLFNKYIDYIKSWDLTDGRIAIHSRKAIKILQRAEKEFLTPSDISGDWLMEKNLMKQKVLK